MHTSTNAHAFSFHIIYWQMLEAHSRFGGYINTLPTGNPWSFPETLDKQKKDGALGLKVERDGKWYSTESSGSLDLSVMSWSSWQSRSYPAGIGQIGPHVYIRFPSGSWYGGRRGRWAYEADQHTLLALLNWISLASISHMWTVPHSTLQFHISFSSKDVYQSQLGWQDGCSAFCEGVFKPSVVLAVCRSYPCASG